MRPTDVNIRTYTCSVRQGLGCIPRPSVALTSSAPHTLTLENLWPMRRSAVVMGTVGIFYSGERIESPAEVLFIRGLIACTQCGR